MTPDELKNWTVTSYTNLLRIKEARSPEDREREIDLQASDLRVKLEMMGVAVDKIGYGDSKS